MENKSADLTALKIDRNTNYNGNSGKIVKLFINIAIAGAIIVSIVFGYNKLFTPATEVSLATVTLVSASQSNSVLTASGYAVAQRKAAVASKGTGRLVYLGVVEGDPVKKDQIIARLEDSDIKAQLDQAKATLKVNEATLKEAENSFNRTTGLFASGAVTKAEVDVAEAKLLSIRAGIELAKAGIRAAEVQLENTLIRAPFDGTVLTKNADVGEIVAPFAASASSRAAVVTMADMTSLQVETDVSESNIEKILINQDCEITLDAYPQIHYAGYVAKVVPTADRAKATVLVKVGFKKYDSKVLPEMSAKVLFLSAPADSTSLNKKPQLMVPSGAVAKRNGRNVVLKIKDDKVTESAVTIGDESGGYIEILSGAAEGDKVIEKINDKIVEGLKVSIKK